MALLSNWESDEFSRFDSGFQSAVAPRWQRKAEGARTPSKRSVSSPSGDRFIPNRAAMESNINKFGGLSKENCANSSSSTNFDSPSKMEYKSTLAASLFEAGGAGSNSAATSGAGEVTESGELSAATMTSAPASLGRKVLAFKAKAPSAPEGHINNLKVLYSQNKGKDMKAKSTRHVPQTAERILDAPELLDDYYLNLLDWSPSNILAVALGQTVYLWNAENGSISQLCTTPGSDDHITSVSWIQEGNYLAVGTASADVQLWDADKLKKVRSMRGHSARVGSLAWNQHVLSSGSRDASIFNHDVRIAAHHIGTLQGHTQEVCGLKWSPDGSQLASGGNDNLLNIWDLSSSSSSSASAKFTFDAHTAAVKALDWCPWQPSLLASGGGTADRTIRFWNTQSGACLNSIDTRSQVCSLKWSTTHKELVSSHGFSENQLVVWRYPSMTKVAELTGHTQRVLHMAASPDGETIVSAAADETLRFWKVFASENGSGKDGAAAAAAKRSISQGSSSPARGRIGSGLNIR